MTFERGSLTLYTRWPNPGILNLSSSFLPISCSALSGSPISMKSLNEASLAPPWAGPDRAPIADDTTASGSALVEVTTLEVNVDALPAE